MEVLHARYPFLSAAREAVAEGDDDLATITADEEHPIVRRAVDRIRNAIEEGTVDDPHRNPRTELLSYPVARVLVSIVDEPGLTRRYALAEARTAHERFTEDVGEDSELRSVADERITIDALCEEFDVTVRSADGGVEIDVASYLRYVVDLQADRWRLVNRVLDDGLVTISTDELHTLLREAIRARVESGLPLDVPDEIARTLAPVADDLRDRLDDLDLDWEIDRVEPDLFPPCASALLDRAADGEPLPPPSRFSLVAFLVTIGMDAEEIVNRLAAHPELSEASIRSQVARLRDGETSAYPSPSCAVTQAYGDCPYLSDDIEDGLCERVSHPLDYYDRRLQGADPADYAS